MTRVCIFEKLYHYIAAKKFILVIIQHTNIVIKTPKPLTIYFLSRNISLLISIVKLYICIVLVNIRNVYVKYSHYGPIQLKQRNNFQNQVYS